MSQSKAKLSPGVIEKARVELNELQSDVPKHIQALRQKILADPKLNFRKDDDFLLRFLRARKFDQERALELLTNYYRQREKFPSLFSKAVSFHPAGSWTAKTVQCLPDRDSEGRAVIVISYQHWDVDNIPAEELFSCALLTYELLLEDEAVQINGIVLVINFEGLSLSHLAQWTPRVVKELVSVFFNAFPLRVKAMHCVNMTPAFEGVANMITSLLSKKLRSRNIFHGDSLASLHDHLDPEILSAELGGDVPPPNEALWAEAMKKQAEVLAGDLMYGFLANE